MSNTFLAGQKLRADEMIGQKIWTGLDTGDSVAITSTEAVLSGFGTSPSTTYKAGWAYAIDMRLRNFGNAGAQDAWVQIRDTNASGTVRMSTVYFPRIPAVSLPVGFYYRHWVANTGSTDITGRVLVLTGDTSTNNWNSDGGASHPSVFACYLAGLASDFPEAFAL